MVVVPEFQVDRGDEEATPKPSEIETGRKRSIQDVLKKHVRIARTRGELARKGLETEIS